VCVRLGTGSVQCFPVIIDIKEKNKNKANF